MKVFIADDSPHMQRRLTLTASQVNGTGFTGRDRRPKVADPPARGPAADFCLDKDIEREKMALITGEGSRCRPTKGLMHRFSHA